MWETRVVLGAGLQLEARIGRGRRYRLRYGRPGDWRVVYEDGVRRRGGREAPYAFRSVEQLRYDFERDVEQAQDPGR